MPNPSYNMLFAGTCLCHWGSSQGILVITYARLAHIILFFCASFVRPAPISESYNPIIILGNATFQVFYLVLSIISCDFIINDPWELVSCLPSLMPPEGYNLNMFLF